MTGQTTAQGYGYPHQQARRHWAPQVATGTTQCAAQRCLMPTRTIHPWQRWDLGHTTDRSAYIGPCHMRCNRTEGAHRGGTITANKTRRRARLPKW